MSTNLLETVCVNVKRRLTFRDSKDYALVDQLKTRFQFIFFENVIKIVC